jgi:hypothetical protein
MVAVTTLWVKYQRTSTPRENCCSVGMIRREFAAGFFVLLAASAAADKHAWRIGTLMEAAEVREVAGSSGMALGRVASSAVLYGTLQGYVIRGEDVVYMVQFRIKSTGFLHHTEDRPNVTVNGPVRYAFEGGKFYVQDADGKEFELVVMKKRLLTDDEKTRITSGTPK